MTGTFIYKPHRHRCDTPQDLDCERDSIWRCDDCGHCWINKGFAFLEWRPIAARYAKRVMRKHGLEWPDG